MATRVQTATTAKKKPVAKAAPAANAVVRKPAAKPAARPAAKAAAATKAAAPKAVAPKGAAPKAPAAKPAAIKPVAAKAPAAKPAEKLPALTKAEKKAAKPKKVKQVRDSFTMPENEYAVLAQVKKSCLKAGVEIKKSDLLRIGVSLIKNLKIAELKDILGGLTPLKVGRPKK